PGGCKTCHPLVQGSEPVTGSGDASTPGSTLDFETIPKRLCAGCHTRGSARSDCLECHDYHVGRLALTLPPTPLLPHGEPVPRSGK
ncbi:MAG: hypothetical protein HY509_05920, partial [Acidobacteria bacterium]|nr:hypothetical protein [Acidobacteriota bacterium]